MPEKMKSESLEDLDAQTLLDDLDNDEGESKGEGDDNDDKKDETRDEGDKEIGDKDKKEPEKTVPDKSEEDKKPDINLKSEADKLREQNPLSDIDDDWEPKSYKELLEKSAEVAEYNRKLEEENKREEKIKEDESIETKRAEIQTYYDREVDQSVKEGRIPPIKDIDDKDDEGVKTQDKIWRFMLNHNEKCEKEGDERYKIISFRQALDLYELKELKAEKEEEKKKLAELKSKRGGMIGSGGSKSGETKSQGYIRGTSMDDVLAEELTNI
jgi:hypothetical protein